MIPITWSCHICGDERPDNRISVFTTDMSEHYGLAPGTLKQNVRYCNDRPSCAKAAPTFRFIGEKSATDIRV